MDPRILIEVFDDAQEMYFVRALHRDRIFHERRTHLNTLPEIDFIERYRLSKPLFVRLLNLVDMQLRRNTFRSRALSSEDQLMIALRFYACGSFQQVVGDTLGVHKSTVSKVVSTVTTAILQHRNQHIGWNNRDVAERKARQIEEQHRFQHVEGLIDGTHIKLQRPKEFEEAYVNRKNFHSINVQLITDAEDMTIMDVNACWPGSTHDTRVFRNSGAFARFNQGHLPVIPGGYLLGDQGYPTLSWLLIPLEQIPVLTPSQRRYNRFHRRLRSKVERTIGILKRKFNCLNGFRVSPKKASSIVLVCCMLHNIARNIPIAEDERFQGILQQERAFRIENAAEETLQGTIRRQEVIRDCF